LWQAWSVFPHAPAADVTTVTPGPNQETAENTDDTPDPDRDDDDVAPDDNYTGPTSITWLPSPTRRGAGTLTFRGRWTLSAFQVREVASLAAGREFEVVKDGDVLSEVTVHMSGNPRLCWCSCRKFGLGRGPTCRHLSSVMLLVASGLL
jgi:hypothetical protein